MVVPFLLLCKDLLNVTFFSGEIKSFNTKFLFEINLFDIYLFLTSCPFSCPSSKPTRSVELFF